MFLLSLLLNLIHPKTLTDLNGNAYLQYLLVKTELLTLLVSATVLWRASKMQSLWDWALASRMVCRYRSSSLQRRSDGPTCGCPQRTIAAWLSGWIQDSTWRKGIVFKTLVLAMFDNCCITISIIAVSLSYYSRFYYYFEFFNVI